MVCVYNNHLVNDASMLPAEWLRQKKENKDISKLHPKTHILYNVYSTGLWGSANNTLSNLATAWLIFKQDTSESESQWRQLSQLLVMNHKMAPLGLWIRHYLHSPTSVNSILATYIRQSSGFWIVGSSFLSLWSKANLLGLISIRKKAFLFKAF